jgi:hypothetical protein
VTTLLYRLRNLIGLGSPTRDRAREKDATVRIVITHLTRMDQHHVCVAGVELETAQHVRPILPHGQLGRDVLLSEGGVFGIAAVAELHSVRRVGLAPAVEDAYFDLRASRLIGTGGAENFWKVLTRVANRRLTAIFGHSLARHDGRCIVPLGEGLASLGCLVPATPPRLYVNERGRLRLDLDDGLVEVRTPVTDLRLREMDHETLRMDAINDLARRLAGGTQCILSVGLTRAWPSPADGVKRHWLQVNNIHLLDDPVGVGLN